ncbi:hypothetical protein O3G_MSEX003346 [Manduca sexta]|uniref:Uncharacterized protein n=1 Tax=Manduca sexta TaxID=7130 RepID=A0A921YRD8_MANSE|nr:hypothetical protein O3G_MSEX003346 [Manduca sexta]KAG6444266.1 hypothetical protein O3G_MSEX003346 [Manduca sexta]
MEGSRILTLSSGATVEFNNDFVGWLTEQCLKSDTLHTSFINKTLGEEQIKLLNEIATLLNINVSNNDMEKIMCWLRRILYVKAQCYTSENDWLKVAPDWLLEAALRLRLLPVEQLPQPTEGVFISACAMRALLRRVHDTRGKLDDPVLELIWQDVRQSAMSKLCLRVNQGDRAIDPKITAMEWRVIDLVLLHFSSDEYLLVTEDTLESCAQKFALVVLCQLVHEHRLHECAGRAELARRWGRAHHAYTTRKFHMSLVGLQRRWFEVRRCSNAWPKSALRTRVQQLASNSSAASYSWTELVAGGMVFTHQDAVESEIFHATSELKLSSEPRVFMEENGDVIGSVEISRENTMMNCASDPKYFVTDGNDVEQAQSTKATNNNRLQRRAGRFSSFLMFESDDDPCSDDNLDNNSNSLTKDDSEEDVISLSEAILRIESEAVTAKRPKLAVHSISATFDQNFTLFPSPNFLEVTPLPSRPPLDNTALNTEPIVILPAENFKLESEDSESISLYPNLESSKEASGLPEVPPESDCVMFQEEIDEKLLMNAVVVIEKMDIEKYMDEQRSARKSGKKLKSIYVEEDDESSRDSGSEWSPESAEESAGWSSDEACDGRMDEALRPVTLRNIDEVRRRAQRKLTAQVAPVTPAPAATAATATAATATTATAATATTATAATATAADATILQASGLEGDAMAPLVDNDTVVPPVAVEVREYCPLGLKTTRLRYGQAMYRREMDAMFAPKDREKRARAAAAKRKARRREKKMRLKLEEQKKREASAKDDMSEWIRQRNLNSLYFGPVPLPLPAAKAVEQRRSSNPSVGADKLTPRREARATSLGKESAPTSTTLTQNISTSVQAQSPILTHALTCTADQATSVPPSSPHSGILRIVPDESIEPSAPTSSLNSEPPTEDRPQDAETSATSASDQSVPPVVRLVVSLPVCPDPSKVPTDCAALWPVQIFPALPQPGESNETTDAAVVKIDENRSASETQDNGECSKKDKSKGVEDLPAKNSNLLRALTGLYSRVDASTPPPLVELTSKSSNVITLEREVFGNLNTMTALEYIQGGDGSLLKIICKPASTPFWIVSGEYLVLAEESEEMMLQGLAYYTLAPPAEIKRIIFTRTEAESAEAASAPRRLAVQGKLYRKLSSAPLRYAQVLCAARSLQHARRLHRRRPLLLYHAARRALAPLVRFEQLLHIYNKDANEEIVLDD